jgi:mono/diheme cytochrome c family protein
MRATYIFAVIPVLWPVAASAQGPVSVERGLQVSIIAGCHDCHTEGYSVAEGKLEPEKALAGNPLGFRGPWGTTYAGNLRIQARLMSERGFVVMLKNMRANPPMPWYNLRAMDESDMASLYRYIKSLGDPDDMGVINRLSPGKEPNTPYIVLSPAQMPKN